MGRFTFSEIAVQEKGDVNSHRLFTYCKPPFAEGKIVSYLIRPLLSFRIPLPLNHA
jgi:hypothetical protein